jgi:hypothetical protein
MRLREPPWTAAHGLLPLAFGHVASVAVVACALVSGVAMDRTLMLVLALALCVPAVLVQAKQAGLALGSFAMSTAHGSGLMLVPALAPLCAGEASASSMASLEMLAPALAALAIHAAMMIAASGLLAGGVCGGWNAGRRWLSR